MHVLLMEDLPEQKLGADADLSSGSLSFRRELLLPMTAPVNHLLSSISHSPYLSLVARMGRRSP